MMESLFLFSSSAKLLIFAQRPEEKSLQAGSEVVLTKTRGECEHNTTHSGLLYLALSQFQRGCKL